MNTPGSFHDFFLFLLYKKIRIFHHYFEPYPRTFEVSNMQSRLLEFDPCMTYLIIFLLLQKLSLYPQRILITLDTIYLISLEILSNECMKKNAPLRFHSVPPPPPPKLITCRQVRIPPPPPTGERDPPMRG